MTTPLPSPITPNAAPIWSDNIPLGPLQEALRPESPTYDIEQKKFWRGPPRPYTDPAWEFVEIVYKSQRLFNSISFSLSTVPQQTFFEYFNTDMNDWVAIHDIDPGTPDTYRTVPPVYGPLPTLWVPPLQPVLGQGDRGIYVREVQRVLAISQDGIFGSQTRQSVINFQASRGITVDGIVGRYTWAAFYGWAVAPPTQQIGARGSLVYKIQGRINELGFGTLAVDGIFGWHTDTQVRAFQRARTLLIDGIVGPQTWRSLDMDNPRPPLASAGYTITIYGRPPAPTTPLQIMVRDMRPNQWTQYNHKCYPFRTRRIRAKMRRTEPLVTTLKESPFSMAIKDLDLGWKVTDKWDLVDASDPDWGHAQDVIGGRTRAFARHLVAKNILTPEFHPWRSEPMPMGEAVVNFYIDCRNPDGSPNIIDSIYIDPLHEGPSLTLYYSDDLYTDSAFNPSDPDEYRNIHWRPVPRDYRLSKGYLHMPPTRTHFMKMEFTNLVPEPYESYTAIRRVVQLFETQITQRHRALHDERVGTGPQPPNGLTTAITAADRFADQGLLPSAVAQVVEGLSGVLSLPTALRFIQDPSIRNLLARMLQPISIPFSAPRFVERSVHTYRQIDVQQDTKVGYFVGLKKVEPQRVKYVADDNTPMYVEHFFDQVNVAENSFLFKPHMLSMEPNQKTALLQSKVFKSNRQVTAVQFATHATEPAQLLPDYDCKNLSYWTVFSSATLSIDSARTSAIKVTRGTGILGGINSALVRTVAKSRVHAAARVYVPQTLTSPLYLRIINDAGFVLAEVPFTGAAGEVIEVTASAMMSDSAGSIRAAVVQKKADADKVWYLEDLSIFEEGLLWEFTNDGGSSWYPAWDIANRPQGVLAFPRGGTNLAFRVTALNFNQQVSFVSIRPWYAGLLSGIAPQTGYVHGGPNINPRDDFPEIEQDPNFYPWARPIPRFWFDSAKKHLQNIVQSDTQSTESTVETYPGYLQGY